MNDGVIKWLDLCSECKKNKPTMPKARCQVAHALRNNSAQAVENLWMFAGADGICKSYDPKG